MPDGSEMFASTVFIMGKSGCEAEHIKANEQSEEVRYVDGNFNHHCCGVVFARWRGLGIFTLARIAPAGQLP
jgi:hypothetical protein